MGTVATGNQWSGSFGPLAAHNGIQNCTGKEFLQRAACFNYLLFFERMELENHKTKLFEMHRFPG
jgi:hypothetical protein